MSIEEREEHFWRKIKPPVQIGPDILDVPYETNRPMSLPEDRIEAIKAGKIVEWYEWNAGLIAREAEAAKIFSQRIKKEVERWGLEAVQQALLEQDEFLKKFRER